MFYSHTFLARKGPLGTVWCAAHLQHKLRKSQYISTNIPSTIEKIIDPQVPIALRMSAHLLLGVVRVYAKQVDYFQEDCNGVVITLNRIYSAVSVNLPDDANHAPVHSITLPQKFSLDALEMDDYFKDGFEDTHLKSQDEITLQDQIPTGEDPFIAITFDEYELRRSSFTEDLSGTGAVPMEEDVIPPAQDDTDAPFIDHDDANTNERTAAESSPQNPPSLEIMRDAGHGFQFNSSPILPDRADPDMFLDELMSNHDKDTHTIGREEVELPDARFSSPHTHQEKNLSGNIDFPIFSEHRSPQLEIRESPAVAAAIAEPKVRKRKRKQFFFDSTTVLSNEHMKKALDDTSDIRRRKRNCPSSSLDVWRQSKRLKKDSIFDEPYLTGSCVELQHIYKEDSVSSKPYLIATTTENAQATSSAQNNASKRDDDYDGETEVLRNAEQASPGGYMPPEFSVPPTGGSNFTPDNFNSTMQSERFDTTEAEMPYSTTIGQSTGNFDSEMETPSTFHVERTSLFDIPEQSPSAGDLDFLEQDDHSLAGFEGTAEFGSGSVNQSTPGLHSLSARTRAVAQYFKKQSPITPIPESSEEIPGDVNLNKVLEGKSRKICARMFYETLVLKSYDLVDLQQEKPYEDVTLKVTPKLAKGDFLG